MPGLESAVATPRAAAGSPDAGLWAPPDAGTGAAVPMPAPVGAAQPGAGHDETDLPGGCQTDQAR